MGPVQEFGGETMSSIPDENHAHKDQSGFHQISGSNSGLLLDDTHKMVVDMSRQLMLNEIQEMDE